MTSVVRAFLFVKNLKIYADFLDCIRKFLIFAAETSKTKGVMAEIKEKGQLNVMYKCDHCPKETATCVKLEHDTHTECVDNGCEG